MVARLQNAQLTQRANYCEFNLLQATGEGEESV
jgi:hypothetical protein